MTVDVSMVFMYYMIHKNVVKVKFYWQLSHSSPFLAASMLQAEGSVASVVDFSTFVAALFRK